MTDKMSRNNKWLLVASLALIIFGLLILGRELGRSAPASEQPSISPLPTVFQSTGSATLSRESQEVTVSRVVDGDTIEIEGGQKVRYIGIDTPETVDPRRPVGCFGREASAENKRLVEGEKVLLVKDVSETDKFGRLLRYVYLTQEDGAYLFVNDYLVRQGFAKASTYPPDVKFAGQFLEAQREAEANQRGLWQKCR